ncbi:MAG: helix-turn-helix domain-containing protein [Hyphomicrobiaceae bacterium]
MTTSAALIDALKRAMKEHGLTYKDAAQLLKLSEASVKRLFSRRNFSLARIESICKALDITLGDLVRLAEAATPTLAELSEAHERELVSDTRLLLTAVLVVNGWLIEDILTYYDFTKAQLIQCLAKLDRLGLIELLPNNRIRPKLAPNFAWRKDGPIERYFGENVKNEFMQSRFDGMDEALLFQVGMLTSSSNAVVRRRLEQVAREFNALHREDVAAPFDERKGCSLILALRPWEPNAFVQLRRT